VDKSVRYIAEGALTWAEFFGPEGKPVSPELANQRALVCASCPLNRTAHGWIDTITKAAAKATPSTFSPTSGTFSKALPTATNPQTVSQSSTVQSVVPNQMSYRNLDPVTAPVAASQSPTQNLGIASTLDPNAAVAQGAKA